MIAAARKYRAHEVTLDCTGEPGPWGVGWVLKLLTRLHMGGR